MNTGLIHYDYAFITAAEIGDIEIIKRLSKRANIHARDNLALRAAAKSNQIEVLKFLLWIGADIHACRDDALRWSAENGHVDTVRLLLDSGVDAYTWNAVALCIAAQRGHLNVVELLLDRGGKLPLVNSHHVLSIEQQTSFFETMCRSNISKQRLFLFACVNNYATIVARLAEACIHFSIEDLYL